MNLAQASLMSFFSLTPKIIQVRICQDKQISDKQISAQLWGMLQFEFSFLICPDALDALNARARVGGTPWTQQASRAARI